MKNLWIIIRQNFVTCYPYDAEISTESDLKDCFHTCVAVYCDLIEVLAIKLVKTGLNSWATCGMAQFL